ncbi:hypothetical protein J4216_02510 [Candidatus Woesearchaeota archaeon]|nr:hypothetical protein [Candidatus Woesearchaeota archaeon]
MSVTIVESTNLGTPFQCPLCRRFFYFEQDYIKHKCAALKNRREFAAKKKRLANKLNDIYGGKKNE